MQRAAVSGASTDRAKFGNKTVPAFGAQGVQVFPVNSRAASVEEINAFAAIRDLPKRPDIVSAHLPPAVLLGQLDEIAAKGCDELWLEPGTASPEVLQRAEAPKLKVVMECSLLRIGVSPDDF
jgi:predicted CoA-binding protein